MTNWPNSSSTTLPLIRLRPKVETVQERIDGLTAKTEVFSPEALEQAGAFVMDYYGRVRDERGFVKAEAARDDEDTESSETEQSSEISASASR